MAGVGSSTLPGVRSGGNSRSPSWKIRTALSKSLSRCWPRSRSGSRVEERRGGRRDEDLVAVRERGDARSAVDVLADVALLGRWSERPCAGPCARGSLPRRARRARRARPPPLLAAVGKAMKNASPCVSTSTPPCAAAASRTIRRCSASASAYRAGPSSCSRRVEPSMSVKSSVTVPSGSALTGRMMTTPERAEPARAPGRRRTPPSRPRAPRTGRRRSPSETGRRGSWPRSSRRARCRTR